MIGDDLGSVTANAYLARPGWVDPGLKPFDWYRLLVLAGAEHHSFPDTYLAAVSAVSAIPDPDRGRADSNLSPIPGLKH